MLKISVKNFFKKAVETYWKQCVALGTDFLYNYRYNIFVRTKWRVIFLLLAFTTAIVALISMGVNYFSTDVIDALSATLRNASGVKRSVLNNALSQAFDTVSTSELIIVGGGLLLLVIAFGYFIAIIALRPTRDALASQKQFIGNVAHELRTPLAIIKTNIEVMLMDEELNKELRHTLSGNVDELDRTADIINNLLSLNTLLNPKEIPFTDVDLRDATDEALRRLTPLATERKIELIEKYGEFRTVHGNTTALTQVAINLIKNAIIHTPAHGSITISIYPNYRGFIELRVGDTGAGIPARDLIHIFEPFYQSDRSRMNRHGGSGLGLTIVSEIVKLHSGKIIMKSTEKVGTTAIITLPCGVVNPDDTAETSEDVERIAIDFTHIKHPAKRAQR